LNDNRHINVLRYSALAILGITGAALAIVILNTPDSLNTAFLRHPTVKFLLWGTGSSLLSFIVLSGLPAGNFKFSGEVMKAAYRQIAALNTSLRSLKLVFVILSPLLILQLTLFYGLIDKSPWLSNDSLQYVGFAPWRTLGYPFFVRIIADISNDPNSVTIIQFAVALLAVGILIAVIHRLFQSGLVSTLAGLFLMTSWPWFFYSYVVLPENLFTAFIVFHLAAAYACARKPSSIRFLAAGVTAFFCILMKPSGIFLLASIPFFLVVFPGYRWRVVGSFILPLAFLLGGQSAVNHQVLGYSGLSNFTGAALAPNALHLLEPKPGNRHARLSDALSREASRYRQEFDRAGYGPGDFDRIRNNFTPMTSIVLAEAARYQSVISRGTAAPGEAAQDQPRFFKNGSPLNRSYWALTEKVGYTWEWWPMAPFWNDLNKTLRELAIDAHRNNPVEWLKFTSWKLYQGWLEVIPFFSLSRNLGPNNYVAPQNDGSLIVTRQSAGWIAARQASLSTKIFDGLAALPFLASLLLPLPLAILGICLSMSGRFVATVFWGGEFDTRSIVLMYSAICLLVYHFELAVAHIALTRYVTAGIPFALILLIAACFSMGAFIQKRIASS